MGRNVILLSISESMQGKLVQDKVFYVAEPLKSFSAKVLLSFF